MGEHITKVIDSKRKCNLHNLDDADGSSKKRRLAVEIDTLIATMATHLRSVEVVESWHLT